MARRASRVSRSGTEWGIRILLALAVTILGYTGVTHTLAYVLRMGNIERAHKLAPGDGRITALLAQQRAGVDATTADRVQADRLARTALRQDPTAVVAASTLGIDAQIRGAVPAARRLFAYSEALSRRDLQTQLWAVEDAVGRGDITGALKHYDIALRTSRNAPDLMFPVLGSAIANSMVRGALARTLAGRPVWGSGFVNYLAGNGPDPRATADLYVQLRRIGVAVADEASAVAIGSLILGGFSEDAWSYYMVIRPGVTRRMSRDARFTAMIATPSPFDWTLTNDTGVTTSIQTGPQGGVLDFAILSGVGGVMLRQMQMLPPGNYRLVGHSSGIDQPEGSHPYWLLSCRDGREAGRIVVPNSVEANGVFAGGFSVSAGCTVQTLSLMARPSEAVSGVTGQIDGVRLSPAP